MPGIPKPRPTKNQHVGVAVIVIVSVGEIETPGDPSKAHFGGSFLEPPIAVVVEIMDRIGGAPGADEEIEVPIAVEILQARASSQPKRPKTNLGGDIGKPGEITGRGEEVPPQAKSFRDPLRPVPEGHRGEIAQPAEIEALGRTSEKPVDVLDRAKHPAWLLVHTAFSDGEQARIEAVHRNTVILLSKAQAPDHLTPPQSLLDLKQLIAALCRQ